MPQSCLYNEFDASALVIHCPVPYISRQPYMQLIYTLKFKLSLFCQFFKDRHYLDKEWGHYFSVSAEQHFCLLCVCNFSKCFDPKEKRWETSNLVVWTFIGYWLSGSREKSSSRGNLFYVKFYLFFHEPKVCKVTLMLYLHLSLAALAPILGLLTYCWVADFGFFVINVALQVGCGAGNTIFPLIATYPEIYVHACDFSQRAVDLVKVDFLFSVADLNSLLISDAFEAHAVCSVAYFGVTFLCYLL